MALSGLHVSWHRGDRGLLPGHSGQLQIPGEVIQAETIASAGTSTTATPPGYNDHVFARLRASSDCFVTFGPSPADPSVSTSPRVFVPSGEFVELYVNPGDYARWAAA